MNRLRYCLRHLINVTSSEGAGEILRPFREEVSVKKKQRFDIQGVIIGQLR